MNGHPSHIQACSLTEARLERWAHKCVKRKHGEVCYKVRGAAKDESYKPFYGFTNYFILLERVSHGSASRPPGSKTLVPAEYMTDFEEIQCS